MLSQVKLDGDEDKHRMAKIEAFLAQDDLDEKQKKQINQERLLAKDNMNKAITKREDEVNPKLVEILKKHYGINFDSSGKGKTKVGATKRSKDECKAEVDRLYQWAMEQEQRKEELAEEKEQELAEQCPFAPSLTNKSRQIYAKEKDKIIQNREKKQKELEEKRNQRERAEKAKLRNGVKEDKNFSRRLVHKSEAKFGSNNRENGKNEENENTNANDNTANNHESLNGISPELDSSASNPRKAPARQPRGDFHKNMMEWCDKRDKNKTQKTVEHWVNTFENMEDMKQNMDSKSQVKKRTKQEQIAHADNLIGTIKKREREAENQRNQQLKGLFQPKVSQYISKNKLRGSSKENEHPDIESQHLNVVYYSRSPQKDYPENTSPHKSNPNSAKKSIRGLKSDNKVNVVQIEEDRKALLEQSLISVRE